MYARTWGETTRGINGEMVTVEVDVTNGMPAFEMVGLPDVAVKEARERVKAAVKNSGFRFPDTHITVNLAPADLKKDGAGLDLPIAMGVLAAKQYVTLPDPMPVFAGELALDGSLRPVNGILPMILWPRKYWNWKNPRRDWWILPMSRGRKWPNGHWRLLLPEGTMC